MTKKFIKHFIKTVPLEIHYLGGKIIIVGIQYGFCKDANKIFGRKTVLKILDLLENYKEYQKSY
jgi:hypothetical protein